MEKEYIGWAIENGFQVIDVNVPKVDPIVDVCESLQLGQVTSTYAALGRGRSYQCAKR